ncbi:MAG TPA: tetratricopeptide repeat protein [Anaerolineae bacterium]|nr:tetratricopeptide repeat protein [Anaerolineae bacterium]
MRSRSEYERAVEFAHKVLAGDVALGDRSAALRQYEACQRALREELAVEPSPATKALYQWIQQAPAEMKPIEAQITNLPIPLTSFIGRKREMAEVKRLLTPSPASPPLPLSQRKASGEGEGVRLLTLTGAGGSGKTRLAIHVATDLVDAFKDGVWWVELAALTDEALVPQTVAKALGVREVPTQPMRETLANFLRTKQLLLALDNCEHLIAACAQIAEQLLNACPHLKILATSREALSVTGESVWYVPTLSVPGLQPVSLVDLLMQYEAICLFVERAAAVKPDFALTERNALPVAQLCQRLDGIPLALELAAARVKVLTVEQITARLDDRFNLLTGGSRTALPRHQTLRAAIDWSYDLLSDKERASFRRLSAFAGGWTLEAAETVCAGEGIEADEVIDLLTHLVDKSLVAMEARGGAVRYRMLETIRQYAQEKLLGSGEAERVQSRHLDFFMKLAEEAEPHLHSADQVTWLDRLETEHDNLRAALECSIASDAEAGLRLGVALIAFWRVRGYWSEGYERLQAVLTVQMSRSVTRGITWLKALSGLAWLSGLQGDYTTDFFEERLASYRELGDKRGTASLLNILGVKAEMQGDYEQAKTFLAESLALRRDVGDKADIVESLINLGRLVRFQGDYRQATVLIEEGLALSQELEDKWSIAWARMHLGYIAMMEGNAKEAVALYIDSLLQFMQLGDKLLIDNNLFGLGMAAVMQGNSVRSARLFGAAEALRENIGYHTSPGQRALYEHFVTAARAQLDEATFEAAWAEGRAMTLEQAIEYALE